MEACVPDEQLKGRLTFWQGLNCQPVSQQLTFWQLDCQPVEPVKLSVACQVVSLSSWLAVWLLCFFGCLAVWVELTR